jgi:hypothetical protein
MSVAVPAAATQPQPAPPPIPVTPPTTISPPGVVSPAQGTSGAMSTSRGPSIQRVWITYGGTRWLRAGAPVLFAAERFVRSGEYRGFPIYTDRSGSPDLIFVSATGGSVLTPYRRER